MQPLNPSAQLPIGVFDSGIGGLTVMRALLERLPHENTIYLGDTARVPYGTKSAEVVTRYSLMSAQFLVDRGIKLLVVACNTASAAALPELRRRLSVPVIGVIEPGARTAAEKTRTGHIGVIGTQATVKSGAYHRALSAIRTDARIVSRACPLFVPLAEEGWTDGEVPALVARKYLSGLAEEGVDTLVLGCTHYPLLRSTIAEVVGPRVTLVDSAEATAGAVEELLKKDDLLARKTEAAEHRYFVTDVPDRFVEVGGRFLGRRIDHAEQVDLRP